MRKNMSPLTGLMCFGVTLFYKNCPPKAFGVSVLDINAKVFAAA